MFVVVKDHERYYGPELADVDPARIVIQPANRGTAAAVLYGLTRLNRFERDAVTAFFPSDHHFADEKGFRKALETASETVRQHPELLVVLGAKAEDPEVGYGWIQPGERLDDDRRNNAPVFRVNRFWEKPSSSLAKLLLSRGCLWNTFVVLGRNRTFWQLLRSTMPEVVKSFEAISDSTDETDEYARATELYEQLPTADFCQEVLTHSAERLAVLRIDQAGWGDLGTPKGVLAAINRSAPIAASAGAVSREASSHSESQSAPGAFTEWLAAYCHRLEEICQTSAANKSRGDRTS